MLEVVYGQTKKRFQVGQLRDVLVSMDLSGTFYIAYPILASADEKVEVDALLVSLEHGLITFQLGDAPPSSDDMAAWELARDEQDKLYFALTNNLSRHDTLRIGRELGVKVQVVTVFPVAPQAPPDLNGIYCDINHLSKIIGNFPPLKEHFLKPLQASLQRVSTIKPVKKRAYVARQTSRGGILKQIEREIANLDQWQKRAAIESPEGLQRIRGLAGSGKTVVLALKAAYLHIQHPDWIIAVTFYTRSLYQQFEDLIRRFSFEHIHDEPNWQNLRILHSWGDRFRDGVYTEIADYCGVTPRDFIYAKNLYGRENAFRGICAELLSEISNTEIEPIYDAVLIDEAQDLPPSFFQLVDRFTRPPKHIIWAYDELQKLSETVMPTIDELFGRDVHLVNSEGQPRQDVILPVCYRNTPWALTVAHALGFGVYRQGGLVQHFDEPSLWEEIGYQVVKGQLTLGKRVVLERRPDSYPEYFKELLDPDDAVVSKVFNDEIEQAEWVAQSIERNLEEDELEHDDILIILPDAYTARTKSSVVIKALGRRGITAHLAGAMTSRDQLFIRQSIAIAHIYRSKGNEAPMVYVLDCQRCVAGHELITLRNVLFTAITRCRGWVRLCGWGARMQELVAEVDAVRKNKFYLNFKLPSLRELENLRMIHRDRTAAERERLKKAEQGLQDFLEAVERGDLAIEALPLELRTSLAKLRIRQTQEDDDFE